MSVSAWKPSTVRLMLFAIVLIASAFCVMWGILASGDPADSRVLKGVLEITAIVFGPLFLEMIVFWFAGTAAAIVPAEDEAEEFARRVVALTVVAGYSLLAVVFLAVFGVVSGVELMSDLQRYGMVLPAAVIAYYFAKSEA